MKRKKKIQTGTAVIFLNTDMTRAKPTSPEDMNDQQRHAFSMMAKAQQQQILSGCGTIVVDLESGDKVCDFNMENYHPPKWALESMARGLLPMIKRDLARKREESEGNDQAKQDEH